MQISPQAHNYSDFLNNVLIADDNYYAKAHYDQIKMAFANHGIGGTHVSGTTISSNTTWNGNYIVDNTVTVNSGVTLTIIAGSSIYFKNGKSLIVNGIINAQGNSSNTILFSSATGTSAGLWNYVQLNSGNSIFQYCTFQYGTYPLYLNSITSGNPTVIENCIFRNSNTGIRFLGCSVPTTMKNCNGCSNTNFGAWCYSSTVYFSGNKFYSNSQGIYSQSTSSLKLYGNAIDNNSQYGIVTSGANQIFLGKIQAAPTWAGLNTICNNSSYEINIGAASPQPAVELYNCSIHGSGISSGYEIYNAPGNTTPVYASTCWWGTDNLFQYSGSVTNVYPLPVTPTPSWDDVAQLNGPPSWKASEPLVQDKGSSPIDRSLPTEEQIRQAKAIITSIPEKKEALDALDILYGILREDYYPNSLGERDSFMNYLQAIRDSYPNKPISQRALQYLIFWNMLAGKNDQVITLSQQALKVLDNKDQGFILGDLAYTYLRKGWPDKAGECLSSLQNRADKDSRFIGLLENDIAETRQCIADGLLKPDGSMPTENKIAVPESFEVVQNYPNPANPSTTIRFSLPEKVAVSVKIVNILGEVVCTLANRPFEAGVHEVVWDGKNEQGMIVSSGIYLYVLQTSNKVISKKLTLLK